jgi:hypothetical protein
VAVALEMAVVLGPASGVPSARRLTKLLSSTLNNTGAAPVWVCNVLWFGRCRCSEVARDLWCACKMFLSVYGFVRIFCGALYSPRNESENLLFGQVRLLALTRLLLRSRTFWRKSSFVPRIYSLRPTWRRTVPRKWRRKDFNMHRGNYQKALKAFGVL